MTETNRIFLGVTHNSNEPVSLELSMANRHGLIAGATGSGKTITMKVLTEAFSKAGVPVFVTDVKGDVSGLAAEGASNKIIDERVALMNLTPFVFRSFPCTFWDIEGQDGHPVRTTISELGPILLSRLLDLNPTQEGVMTVVFKLADDEGMLLLDINDLKALLNFIDQNDDEIREEYGKISSASIGAIQRKLVALEADGAETLFGEPAITLHDLMQRTSDGYGAIQILSSKNLITRPKVYATFLLWLLSELFETLPEVGDVDKPKLVLFFDEAHLLFDDMPDVLLDKLKQVMLLIRSKGVGVYFVTQNPNDIHNDVLGQLGNRLIHALRMFSAKDKKRIKALSDGFPENPDLDIETTLLNLGVGEAVVSTLDRKGLPLMSQHTIMAPPTSSIGGISEDTRQSLIKNSFLFGRYDTTIDRESAYELLLKRKEQEQHDTEGKNEQEQTRSKKTKTVRKSNRQSPMEAFVKSTLRAIGSQAGRQITREIMRGIFGSMKR